MVRRVEVTTVIRLTASTMNSDDYRGAAIGSVRLNYWARAQTV